MKPEKKEKKVVTTTTVTTVTETIINENELTEIICVLDRSGSMGNIVHDMIGGFNKFIDDQKKEVGKCNITVALFDDRYELLYDSVDIQKTKSITYAEWYERGSTALYDAIGKTVLAAQERHLKSEIKPDKVLVVVVTDGHENASREFTKESIKTLMNKKEEEKWAFIYLAANQDAFAVGNGMGFSGGNTINFSATADGALFMNDTLSRSAKSYRSVDTNSADYDIFSSNIISNVTNDPNNPNKIIINTQSGTSNDSILDVGDKTITTK